MGKLKNFLFISSLLLGGGCASVGEYGSISPPKNMGDACAILNEKSSWQKPTFEAAYQWKVSPGTILSFMRYESSFRHDARPVDSKGNLMSSALGYSQALNKTWSDYETARGKGQRQNFDDSADFIGWYINILSNKAFVAKDDPTNLYLAYHEGIGGYDPDSGKIAGKSHDPHAKGMLSLRQFVPAKHPKSEKRRLEKEGRQSFKCERYAKNVSHEAGIFRPVHAKLKLQHDTGDNAHGKIDDKQAAPEFSQF